MRTRLLLFASLTLTVCTLWSQDTIVEGTSPNRSPGPVRFYVSSIDTTDTRPISFPFWMVQQMALDLEEKQHLEQITRLDSAEISGNKDLVSSLEKQSQHRQLQLELLRGQLELLQLQLKAKDHAPLQITP